MEPALVLYALAGFAAQLVDSALGMAFGSLSSALLLATGFPPQSLSATVHMAEVFGGGASALSHWRMKNIDPVVLKKLLVPAIIGAALGALLVTRFDGAALRPWLGFYFTVIGSVVIIKTLRPALIPLVHAHRETLGFFGGFFDAFGGAGWGEFVSSGLLLRGSDVRTSIGSLNTVEFIVSVTVSVVFFSTTGITSWPAIIALSAGAIIAAPFGALLCKVAPAFPLKLCVGGLIVAIGLKTLLGSL